MTLITVNDRSGYSITFLVPAHHPVAAVRAFEAKANGVDLSAPVDFFSGAPLAQTGAPVAPGPPKGTGTGAKSAPVACRSGAPLAPVPLRAGPVSGRPEDKISFYRDEIKSLTAQKLSLAPAYDSHEATLRFARAKLKDSHDAAPVFADPEIMLAREKLHDRILASSEANGRQSRLYREVTGLIAVLNGEIERLETRKQ